MKINKSIEIVVSGAKELSSMSLASRQAVRRVLAKHYTTVRITVIDDVYDLEALRICQPDLVFLGMKFLPVDGLKCWQDTKKLWVSDYLQLAGINCTGSGMLAHKLELNKTKAKRRVQQQGLATSPFYLAPKNKFIKRTDILLQFPLFVKPSDRGGGLGIDSNSIVHSFEQLLTKTQSITDNYQSDSLVEEYLLGREFSVAILKNSGDEFFAMPLELVAPQDVNGDRMLSSQVKSADTESYHAVTDKILKTKITSLALSVFHALGARDYGRIDIRLDRAGTPHFLEANLIPSLLEGYGNFAKACVMNIGLDYESMILEITALGLNRGGADTPICEFDDELVEAEFSVAG